MNEVKQKIKELKVLLRRTKPRSEERKEIRKKIKLMEKESYVPVSKEKQVIIDKILKIRPEYLTISIDLSTHSIENLENHLKRITAINKKAL